MLTTIDHLVYATPDLDSTIAELERTLGTRAAYGGRHPGRGTRNALIALSDISYLEIVGPDPGQPDFAGQRWFGIDSLTAPRLVTWAAKVPDVDRAAADAAARGVRLGTVASGARETAGGSVIRWTFTNPDTVVEDGLVPFLIDWGTSVHPASSAPRGPTLRSLRAEHPEPARIEHALSAIGLALPVALGTQPGLIAGLSGARGERELR